MKDDALGCLRYIAAQLDNPLASILVLRQFIRAVECVSTLRSVCRGAKRDELVLERSCKHGHGILGGSSASVQSIDHLTRSTSAGMAFSSTLASAHLFFVVIGGLHHMLITHLYRISST